MNRCKDKFSGFVVALLSVLLTFPSARLFAGTSTELHVMAFASVNSSADKFNGTSTPKTETNFGLSTTTFPLWKEP